MFPPFVRHLHGRQGGQVQRRRSCNDLPFAIDQFFEVLNPARRVCDDEAIVQPFSGSRTYAEVFAVADEFGDLHGRIGGDNNIAGTRPRRTGCRQGLVTRETSLYRRTPTRLTPPFALPPAL